MPWNLLTLRRISAFTRCAPGVSQRWRSGALRVDGNGGCVERLPSHDFELLPRAMSVLAQQHATAPEDLWRWIERLQESRQAAEPRPRLGVVHTPVPVAALMATRLLHGCRDARRLRVLDAGCGSGRLLTAVLRLAAGRGMRFVGEGVDSDASAAWWAQALAQVLPHAASQLVSWNIVHADFLLDYAPRQRFDCIIANPPYIAARDLKASYRNKLRARCDGVARSDLSALFVDRMLDLLRPGGRLCVIVPNKLLAADYAAGLRRRLLQQTCVEEIWDLASAGVFAGCATYPVILVLRSQRPPQAHCVAVHDADGTLRTRWPQSALLALPQHVVPLDLPATAWPLLQRLLSMPQLGEMVNVGCGIATSGFNRAIDRGRDQIICSGDIAPFQVHNRRRFAAQQLGLAARSLARQKVTKVVIPGMFRRLHAAFDDQGDLLGRVYFVPVQKRQASRRALLLALLNSRLYAVLYRGLFGGVAQSGGYLRLNAPYLRRLPWPRTQPPAALRRAVRRLEATSTGAGDRATLDACVEDLFGLDLRDRRLLARLDRRMHGTNSPRPPSARNSTRRSRPKLEPRRIRRRN